jgi:hypothetical protein
MEEIENDILQDQGKRARSKLEYKNTQSAPKNKEPGTTPGKLSYIVKLG